MPELGVVEDRRVVVEADPGALVEDQLAQAVVQERLPDQVVDRVAEDGPDHDGRRDQQRIRRELPDGNVTPGAPTAPRRRNCSGGRGGSGEAPSHSSARSWALPIATLRRSWS